MSVGQPYDIAARIVELKEACAPLVQHLVEEGIYRPTTAANYIGNRSNAGQRHVRLLSMMAKRSTLGIDGAPVDLAHLSDLRVVFDHVWVTAGKNPNKTKGLPEEDFCELAAPILCPTYPNRVAEWFCTVDTAESGYVDWRLLSQYLIDCSNAISEALAFQFTNQVRQEVSPQQSPRAAKYIDQKNNNDHLDDDDDEFDDLESTVTGMQSTSTSSVPGTEQITVSAEPPKYNEVCEGRLAHPPGYHVHNVACHTRGYIGSCSDGSIRSFNPATLRADGIIHHSDGRFSSSMSLGGNNLFVSERDGVVLVYDVTGECTRNGNIRKAFRIQSQTSVAPLEIQKTVKFDQLKMERPARAVSGATAPTSVEIPLELIRLKAYSNSHYAGNTVSPLGAIDFGDQLLTAVAPQMECRDPHFFAGFGRGVVAWYTPELAYTHTVTPRAVFWDHTDQVSKLYHCTQNLQLQGLVSASIDGTINVVDLDKMETKLTFKSTVGDLASTTGGGWVEGKRSFTTFDISKNFPLLAAAGTMRYVTLWSGQSRRLVASFSDHKDSIIDVKFNDAYRQVISLSKDRTIRVWDLRTMGLLQVITDKERKFTDDPLTAVCISKSNNIVAWSGTPFVYPAITGTLALLTQGHPTSFVDASDCDPVAISVNRQTLTGVDPATGATKFEYKSQSPIKSVAHDPSWKRLHILTEANQLEVVIVGQPRPTKRIDVEHLRLRCITYRPSCEYCAAGLVAGSNLSIFFFTDKNVLGLLMPMHVVILDSLSKNSSHPIRTVTGLTSMKNDQIVASMATGEIAVLGMGLNVVNVLFVFSGNERLSNVLALLRLGLGKKTPLRTGSNWARAIAATKREGDLGASSFTKFRHEGQVQLHKQCDALTPLGDGRHAVVSYGNGDIGILSADGPESAFLACFPGSYTTGTGVAVAAGSGYILVGDDEGFLSVFRCTIPDEPANMEKGSRKYFSSCYLFLVVVLRFRFGISSVAVTPDGNKALIGFDCGVLAAVSLSTLRLVWSTHDLECGSAKRREHQYVRNFKDTAADLHSSISTTAGSNVSLGSLRGTIVPMQSTTTVKAPQAAIALATPPQFPGDGSSTEGDEEESSSCEMNSHTHDGDAVVEMSSLPDNAAQQLPPMGRSSLPAWKRPPSRQFTLRKTISRPGSSQEPRLAPMQTTLPPRPASSSDIGCSEDYLSAWSLRNAPDAATTASIQLQRGTQERLGNLLVQRGSAEGSGASSSSTGSSRVSLVARKRTAIRGGYYKALSLGGVHVDRPHTATTEGGVSPPNNALSDAEDELEHTHPFDIDDESSSSRPGANNGPRNPFIRLL